MFRISTRIRYGVRAMIDLAMHHGDGPVLLGDVARRQAISRKYLHSVLTALRAGGLVRSVRGRGGGYVLTRSPEAIRLDEVVRTLEGSFALVECVDCAEVCPRSERCVARDLWADVGSSIETNLRSRTLAGIAAEAQLREGAEAERLGRDGCAPGTAPACPEPVEVPSTSSEPT